MWGQIRSWHRELPLLLFIILIYFPLKMHHLGARGPISGQGPPSSHSRRGWDEPVCQQCRGSYTEPDGVTGVLPPRGVPSLARGQ